MLLLWCHSLCLQASVGKTGKHLVVHLGALSLHTI